MKLCHTCGSSNDDMATACVQCGNSPHKLLQTGTTVSASFIPANIPVKVGYVTLDQLNSMARNMASHNYSEQKTVELPMDWLSVSMNLMKWMGIAVICLVMAFFMIVIMKAFM